MTAKVTELYKNKWNTVVEKELDNGCRYIYNKAEWCGSQGIAILPFRNVVVNNWGFTEREYLGRFEVCPAHSEEIELCSITGGMDKEGEEPIVTAWRELIEEGGYKVPVGNIIYLGTVRPSKASDTTTHLFAVDLGDVFEEVEAVGDGTIGEEGAYCEWITGKQLADAKDPLLHSMVMRLLTTPIDKKDDKTDEFELLSTDLDGRVDAISIVEGFIKEIKVNGEFYEYLKREVLNDETPMKYYGFDIKVEDMKEPYKIEFEPFDGTELKTFSYKIDSQKS